MLRTNIGHRVPILESNVSSPIPIVLLIYNLWLVYRSTVPYVAIVAELF